ncbi:DNA cytosine methyltransferase (plasmid) [Sphingomonas paeninsulae]|uniref:DNA (cytosine-5-)-methyltransferase n=1 Tax=Sphingomonas paeninsulae TaxID=2319844 RepID=A0A494TJM1_SPHPE|nr:DNA cytosine methyltransferase [Sphingomonas paeninsulae]
MNDLALRPLNIISLCAGVGGLECGIRIAEPGARGIAYVEREAAAAASLVASMEAGWFHPAPVWSDLATFDARPWRGRVHCVASGDPCQPNSVAGKRGGASDDRFLIDQVVRIVDECRPDRVFRENVAGNADGQLAALVPALERLGYRVAAGIFSAAGVGASHRRERLFIMADRDLADATGGRFYPRRENPAGLWHGLRGQGGEAFAGDRGCHVGDTLHTRSFSASHNGIYSGEEGAGTRNAQSERRSRQLADTLYEGSQGLGPGNDQSRRQIANGYAGLRRGAGLCAVRQRRPFAPGPADPFWHEVSRDAPDLEPALCRVAHGVAGRIERLRAAGNGVCPLAAADAWMSLSATLQQDRLARNAVLSAVA